jgi:trk system potassium uptake protein
LNKHYHFYKNILLFIKKYIEPPLEKFRNSFITLYEEYFLNFFKFLFLACGVVSLITLTIEFGFYYPREWIPFLKIINSFIVNFLIVNEFINLFITSDKYINYIKIHKPELIIVSLILIQKYFENPIINYLTLSEYETEKTALAFIAITQFFLIFSNFITLIRGTKIYNNKKVNPSFMFFISFASIILIGTLLLSLPKAQFNNNPIPIIDILFTVISATCVTGLSTIDIASSLTTTGQLMLLILIQVGGLGLITLTSFFSFYLAGQASVSDTMMMKDLLSENAFGKVKNLIKEITLVTITIEIIGAIFLFISFPSELDLSIKRKIFLSVFHSISAFCNAGFSLFPNSLSEYYFRNNYFFITVIMLLIVFGGLGFSTFSILLEKYIINRKSRIHINVSSKLSLMATTSLLFIGAIVYFMIESKHSLSGFSLFDKIFQSLFYSITTRTAGFNTLDMAKLSEPIVFFSLFLMWVGASPNSTGGGIKTTTFALAILQILNFIRGKQKLEIFKREISQSSVYRASSTIVLSLFVIFGAIFVLVLNEKFSFLDICFEVVSAYGTAGLSRGITGDLSLISKVTLCLVMFMGRVGVLTILLAIIPKKVTLNYSYPVDYVIVG